VIAVRYASITFSPFQLDHGPNPMTGTESIPKYLQLAQALELRIQAGQCQTGKMPTVRDLAEQHRVSIVTASRALQVLRDKGLIHTVERSGCYLVPPSPEAPAESWALVLRTTAGKWQQSSTHTTRAGFDAVAAREGVTFPPLNLDLAAGERDLRRQVRAAARDGVGGVFFLPSRLSDELLRQDEQFLAACRAEGLPVVLIERNLRGLDRPLEHDLVANDDLDGGRRCTRHLLDQGRRRVACVIASPTSSHQDRLAGYLHALETAGRAAGQDLPRLVLELPPDLPGREAYGWLADRLLKHRADGAICYHDYTALGLLLELLRRGARVPHDLAVVGFDDLPIGQTFTLGITTYAFPAEAVARQALRLMRERVRDPQAPPVRVAVPGRLIVRESSAAAPGRG
jgi:LacI family transcriptional regulator